MGLGKFLGFIFGLLVAGPMGAVIGVIVGHYFDSSFSQLGMGGATKAAQKLFFEATFMFMGFIAKSDGRVSEQEIQMARHVMARMQLTEQQKRESMHLFNQGKDGDFDFNSIVLQLRRELRSPFMRRMFVDIQLQSAIADGHLAPQKKQILTQLCSGLGLSVELVDELERMFNASSHFYQGQYSGQSQSNYHSHRAQQSSRGPSLSEAYDLLGLQPSATKEQVKKAYRKSMSQNHPDKLVAQGLPEEMIKLATEKTQQIRAAFEQICAAKGY